VILTRRVFVILLASCSRGWPRWSSTRSTTQARSCGFVPARPHPQGCARAAGARPAGWMPGTCGGWPICRSPGGAWWSSCASGAWPAKPLRVRSTHSDSRFRSWRRATPGARCGSRRRSGS